MSKSSKKKPTAPIVKSPTTSSVPTPRTTVEPTKTKVDTNKQILPKKPLTGLIHIDTRAKWFLGICAGIFVLSLLFKIHNISLAAWNQILPDGSDPRRGLIAGTPRPIRMDDYCVAVPTWMSSINQGFPAVNETLGGEKSGTLFAPTYHIINLFRPAMWGSLFLDTERSVIWTYNFAAFILITSSFLFFLLITKNNFWISAFGALWLSLSSGTMWWMSGSPALAISYFNILFIAGILLLYEKEFKLIKWIGLAAVFCWALGAEIFITYPSYQVPLGLTFLCLFIGFIADSSNKNIILQKLPIKLGIGIGTLIVFSIFLYFSYKGIQSTVEAMANTVYPGKRDEPGGTGFIANWYVEFFSWLISDTKLPKGWLNICETSHYLNFVPIVLPLSIGLFVYEKKINWQILLVSVCVLAFLAWIDLGFPRWLAKATFFNMCTPRRVQLPLGISGVILTILFLQYTANKYIKTSVGINILLVLGIIGFMAYAAMVNLEDSDGFFKFHQLFIPVLFFIAISTFLLYTFNIKYRQYFFAAGVTLFLLHNLGLHPLSVGLSPITEHALYMRAREIVKSDPEARWVNFGNQYISYMLSATGAKLMSGVKFVPNRQIMKVLDPQAKRDSAYNRYAHTVYQTYINGTDSVVIVNNFEDGYVVAMDPCSPKLQQLNAKYIVFDRQPQPVEIRCLKLIQELGSLRIYQRIEEAANGQSK